MGREVHPQGAAVRLHHLGVAHVLVPHDQRVPLLLGQLRAFAHKAVEGLADHIARAAVDEFGERAVCVDGDPVLVGEQHGVAGPSEGGAEQRLPAACVQHASLARRSALVSGMVRLLLGA